MAQFVFVASSISNEDFEMAMEAKTRSGSAVKFVPQGQTQISGVASPGMSAAKPQNSTGVEVLHNVRFEWDQNGAEFGAEIVRVMAGHHHKQEQQHEPAA